MRTVIPYGRQFIDEHDIAAVVAVLRSELVTQGVMPALAAVSGERLHGAAHPVRNDIRVAMQSIVSSPGYGGGL